MKKIFLLLCIGISLVALVGSSVWEGTAAAGGDFPATGLFMATNSFPVNTVVDVTNLENEKTISVIVSSVLENSGLLARLSRDAAIALGIQGQSMSRIRMTQSKDPAALSRLTGGRVLTEDEFIFTQPPPENEIPGKERLEGGELIVDLPNEVPVIEPVVRESPIGPDMELTMIPAETRPPEENSPQPDPSYFVPPVSQSPPVYAPPPSYAPPAPPPSYASPPPVQSYDLPVHTVPLISSLEKGKYYIQVAAYSRMEAVQRELSRIGPAMPLAVMNAGSADKPLYRVLIGPVSLGESSALLQRYKAIYTDAFVRVGS